MSQLPVFSVPAVAAPVKPVCPSEGRPDRVAANIAARSCGGRVEVTGELSETEQLWAEPDGSFTADRSLGIARFQREGKWVDVDLTLVRNADGSITPKAHPGGLKLSGPASAGAHDLVSVGPADKRFTLGWTGALPQPVIDGTKVIYPEVMAGVDLVVEVGRTGFEQFLVVKNAAAVPLVKSVQMALKPAGQTAKADQAGGLVYLDAVGEVVASTPAPLMWDAAKDPLTQEPTHVKEVNLALAPAAQSRMAEVGQGLTLTPDQAWLTDPARQFPITIDPGYFPEVGFDTYVQSNVTWDVSGETELRIGTQNSGSTKARSFVNLSSSGLNKSKINWASIKLWQSGGSCAAAGWEVWRTATNASTATRWSNMPTLAQLMGTSASGSCNNWVEIDATALYQYAADANWGEFTAGLKVTDETTNSYYKTFRSTESSTLPHVSLNWNEPPQVSSFTTSPATSSCVTGVTRPWMTSRTPRLSSAVWDSDGTAANLNFEWWVTGGGKIGGATVSNVASGSAGSVDVPDGALTENGTFSWRVQGADPSGSPVGDWSPWCEFTVDSTKPGAPIVTTKDSLYPSVNTANTWGHGGYGKAGLFTFTPATGTNDLASFSYQLDSQTSPTVITATATFDVTVTPSEDGVRTLTVWAKDKAGNQSDPATYVFNVGRAGLTQPLPGANVIKSTKLGIEGDGTYKKVKFQYRRGPGAVEADIPLANLRTATGGAVASYPVLLSDLGTHASWSTLDTLGDLGGVVQVRARMYRQNDTVADGMIRNATSGRCLNAEGVAPYNNGTRIILWDCTGTGNEKFELGPDGMIRNPDSGRCLNISGSGPYVNGTPFILYDCTGTPNELFTYTQLGQIQQTGTNMCLNIEGAGPYNNGNRIILWTCGGGPNELFTGIDTGYSTQWVTLNADPNGDNAASTQVGAGSLNLLTGDHTLTATDIDEFGLSVSRTASSREPVDGWMPQGERLPASATQVTDLTSFAGGNASLGQATGRGQGSSTDSVAIAPLSTTGGDGSQGDTFTSVGGDAAGLRLGMQPGKRYRVSAWVYVPASTGLNTSGLFGTQRGLRITAHSAEPIGWADYLSPKASFVDGWQQLTLDLNVPPAATQMFVRLYNGHPTGDTSKVIYWDNLSVRELVAPFGPQWRGGISDAVVGVDYTSLEFPSADLASITLGSGGQVTFARSLMGGFFPQPGAETLSLTKLDDNTYQLSEIDGTVVEFVKQAGSTKYVVTGTWDNSTKANTTTRFVYDLSDNRALVTQVISPTEPGVANCEIKAGNPVPGKGCEVLQYEYAPLTTARGSDSAKPWEFGDIRDQVRTVRIWSWNPAANAVDSVDVARYLYDNIGQLRHVYDPRTGPSNTNIALNSTATGSTACGPTQGPGKAVNGTIVDVYDKWCSTTGPRWLQTDLGAVKTVNTITIDHAAAGGESAAWNTKDYDLQTSVDATNWTTVAVVTGNTQGTTTHHIAAISARYVRLNVTTPAQNGDLAARIYELKVFGHDGASARLTTRYDYDAAGRLTKLTPAGQLEWMFDYGTLGPDTNGGNLHRVRRPSLVQGSKTTRGPENATRVVYRVPTTGTGAPYNMDSATIGTWGQSDLPTYATAIFGPEDDPGTVDAGATAPTGGYKYANIHYLNTNGQQVNAATPAASGVTAGNIDSTQYDKFGNVVWSLEATNRLIALGQHPNASSILNDLKLNDKTTVQRANALSTESAFSGDGKDLLTKTGPIVQAATTANTVQGRATTLYTYDENKPDGATYHLVTKEESGLAVTGTAGLVDPRVTETKYAPVEGTASGWILRKPTQVIADAGADGDKISTYTVFDLSGRVLKTWGAGTTSAKGAKQTVYYTPGVNSVDASCGNRPEWAGTVCLTQVLQEAVPTRRTTAYNRYGDEATVVEANAGKTRTTTTTFDTVGRVDQIQVVANDATTPIATTKTTYDPATGQAVQTTAGGATVATEYDQLGRVVKYTDADGAATTSEFDRYGRAARTVDPTGTVTYGYDRAAEPRGMLTTMTDSNVGAFTAGYSPDGQLTTVKYPGGITRTDTLDANLKPVQRLYKRDSDSVELYKEAITNNSNGQWATHTYNGRTERFTYDRLGRLSTAVQDLVDQCTVRQYDFAGAEGSRTNRTTKKTWLPGPGGGCADPTAGPANQTISSAYDSADRILTESDSVATGTYTYDEFGRTTKTADNMAINYHANDMVATQTLGTQRQSWTLDPNMRLRVSTTETQNASVWTNTSTKFNHYSADNDSPKWISDTTANGNWTRNIDGPGGDLAATVTQAGAKTIQATNLHGDIAFTVDLATPTLCSFYYYDEYGNPINSQPGRYGWLGGKQRSSEALGSTMLMGVRLYSPSVGRFLSLDPVPGGSCNTYEYTCADPTNKFDLNGKCWDMWKSSCRTSLKYRDWPGAVGGALTTVFTGGALIKGARRGYKTYQAYKASGMKGFGKYVANQCFGTGDIFGRLTRLGGCAAGISGATDFVNNMATGFKLQMSTSLAVGDYIGCSGGNFIKRVYQVRRYGRAKTYTCGWTGPRW